MRIKVSLVNNIISISGLFIFLSLFPFDFLIYTGTLPFLSKFPFGISNIILILSSIIILLRINNVKCKRLSVLWLYIFVFLSFVMLTFIRVIFDYNADINDVLLVCTYFYSAFAGYLFGKSLQTFNYNLIFFVLFIVLLISTFYFTDFNSFSYLLIGKDMNYLRLADTFVFCSFGVISYCNSKLLIILSFLLSIISLFLITSRFAIFCYIFFAFPVILYRFKKIGIMLLSIVVFLIFLLNNNFLINSIFSNSRIGSLIFNPTKDGSLLARVEQISLGMNAIRNNWFIGDFKGQLLHGSYGSYIHNIFSYWRQYGLIPFLLFLCILILTWVYYFFNVNYYKNNKSFLILTFLCLIYVTTGVLFAKSFVYIKVYYSIGIALSLSRINKDAQ